MNISPFLSMNCSCGEALQWSQQRLSQAGLRFVQTFDLQAARTASHACPNHGTDACDCQMVVVLVYGNATEPITLILHGNDGQTWLSIAEDASQNNSVTADTIRDCLKGSPLITE